MMQTASFVTKNAEGSFEGAAFFFCTLSFIVSFKINHKAAESLADPEEYNLERNTPENSHRGTDLNNGNGPWPNKSGNISTRPTITHKQITYSITKFVVHASESTSSRSGHQIRLLSGHKIQGHRAQKPACVWTKIQGSLGAKSRITGRKIQVHCADHVE